MNAHQESQNAYFAAIDHGERFRWQTVDPFVMEREHATVRPLFDALRRLQAERGELRVLESGCGEGVNFVHLRQLGLSTERVRIEGVDPCAQAVDVAKQHGLYARLGDGLALPYPDASFDAVFCRDVLHHLADDAERSKFLSEMTRVAKPGGFVAAVEPNPYNLPIYVLSFMVRAERGLRSITPARILRLKPGAQVTPATPSAAWRATWYLRRHPFLVKALLRVLGVWEIVCRHLPTALWSYRIYIWRT